MNRSGFRAPQLPPPPTANLRRERSALRAGLVVSVLAHLVVLLLYPALAGIPAGQLPSESRFDPEAETTPGLELLTLREEPETEPESHPLPPPALPEPPPDPAPDAVAADPSPPGADPADAVAEIPGTDEEDDEAEGLSLAERLQPRLGDPRVWAPIPAEFTELTEFERAEILLRGMLQSWNDSVAMAQALSDRAGDWTYTDASGRRWGLGPGRLYLGDISIPLPQFEFAPGLIEDRLDRGGIQADLARGAVSEALRETWSDRARVIRERMEADRSPPSGGGSGGE